MATSADSSTTLERKVSTRLRDDESHRRLSEVLTAVAVAAIHPARHRLPRRLDPDLVRSQPGVGR